MYISTYKLHTIYIPPFMIYYVHTMLSRFESQGHLFNFPLYDHVVLQLQWKNSLQWFCGMNFKKESTNNT